MSEAEEKQFYQPGDAPDPSSVGDDVVISSDTRRDERIPPGQTRTKKWPVLDAHGTPRILEHRWNLRVFGLVEQEHTYSLEAFRELPRTKVFADFHCVTSWSRLGNLWEGVSARWLLEQAGMKSNAAFVVLHGCDMGFTTNLPLAEFLEEDVVIADLHDGRPLTADHGGPVRAIVPKLYAWKSAKWLKGIELTETDQAGYWENGGYHMHGDPWKEERFQSRGGWF